MQHKTDAPRNRLPRWRGFNLLEMFSAARAVKGGGDRTRPHFREDDFRWISEWGFDFVRLPMSYHVWSNPDRWLEVDESVLAGIDEAVGFGKK